MVGEDHALAVGIARGTDPRRPLLAEALAVPVAPEEGVGGEEARHDAQRLDAVHLVVAGQLGVDRHWPQILGAIGGAGLLHRHQELVEGGIAIGVGDDLDIVAVAEGHPIAHLLLVHHRIGAVIGLLARRRNGVGLAHVGGLALGGAIAGELDAADLEVVAVDPHLQLGGGGSIGWWRRGRFGAAGEFTAGV